MNVTERYCYVGLTLSFDFSVYRIGSRGVFARSLRDHLAHGRERESCHVKEEKTPQSYIATLMLLIRATYN